MVFLQRSALQARLSTNCTSVREMLCQDSDALSIYVQRKLRIVYISDMGLWGACLPWYQLARVLHIHEPNTALVDGIFKV